MQKMMMERMEMGISYIILLKMMERMDMDAQNIIDFLA
jgi:hypothetical protein